MPNRRYALFKLILGRAVLLGAMPTACAIGVEPDFGEVPLTQNGGSGGALGGPGGSGAGAGAKAGATSTSGGSAANPFGGSASSGGKAGSSSGGGAGSSAGGSSGAAGGGAGGASGSSGSAGSGGGAGGCGCTKTLTWTDNTVMNWTTGDCVTTGGKTYLYVGTKAQTYANAQCNPAKQEPWCPDMDNDYKFMACP